MKISWCGTMSKEDMRSIITVATINNQTIKPFEIVITEGGNISQGRNNYLVKAKGDYIASFDGGCIYDKDYSEKMVKRLEETKADIVFGIVKPVSQQNRIQRYCVSRMPDYDNFTEEDWNNFIPSNRQVIFKREIIAKLGLLPEELWRSDDTYWYQKAKKLGLKFAYCKDAVVYWEMKKSLKSYLKSVYNDTKCDYQFGIKPFGASKRKKTKKSLYVLFVMGLALIFKISGKLSRMFHFKRIIQ